MATPRRSARSQNVAVNYTVPVGYEDADESDVEGAVSKPRSAKKAAQKPTTSTPSSQTKKKPLSQALSTDSLFDIVKTKSNAIPDAASNWWREEKVNEAEAVAKAANLLLQAAGLEEILPPEAFEVNADVDEEVRKVIEAASTQPIRPFLTGKDKNNKTLRANLAEFWSQFMVHASEDDILSMAAHPFLTWLFALSTCQLREVRLSATIAATEIMTSLLSRANDAHTNINKLDRLVKAGGGGKQRNKEQLESSMNQKNALEELMQQIFTSVFVHRTRDTSFEIRARCIKCLGECILTYKTKFFDNSYLKYLGWSLNDKEGTVRQAGLEALISLYEEGKITELEMFTTRFCSRIVEMRLDKDDSVANTALKLLTIMARHKLLSDEQIESVYKLLVEDSSAIRSAAAAFIETAYVKGTLDDIYHQEIKAGKKVDRNENIVKGLIEMITSMVGSEIYDDTVFALVESLLPFVPSLQDWSLICGILMDDGDGVESLAQEDKTCLAQFLVGALVQASNKEPTQEPRPKGKKKKDEDGTGFAEGSMYIATALPGLLKKFSAEPSTLKALVQLPGRLQLESLTDRQGKNVKEAVEILVDIAKKAQDEDLAVLCSKSMVALLEGEYPLKSAVAHVLDLFFDFLRSDLRKILDAIKKTSKATAAQALRIRMVLAFCSNLDILTEEHDDLLEALLDLLKHLSNHQNPQAPEQTVRCLVSLAVQTLLWRCNSVFDAKSNEKNATLDAIVVCRDAVVNALHDVMTSQLEGGIRLQAAIGLADVVQAFGKKKASGQWSERVSKRLSFEINSDVKNAIHSTILERLSGELEVPDTMGQTLAAAEYDFDELDSNGISKQSAAALMKLVLYDGSSDEEFFADAVATLLLYKPYGASTHQAFVQLLSRAVEDWRSWLACHQKMYTRILGFAQQKQDVVELTTDMIDAVAKTALPAASVYQYLMESFQWAIKGNYLGFLDVASLHIKSLTIPQAQDLYNTVTEVCTKRKIDLSTREASPIQHINSFLKKLKDLLPNPNAAQHKGASSQQETTPSQARKKARASRDRGGSDDEGLLTPMSSLPAVEEDEGGSDEEDVETPSSSRRKSGARGKPSTQSSARKGKSKRSVAEEEEDEEGFISTKRSKR